MEKKVEGEGWRGRRRGRKDERGRKEEEGREGKEEEEEEGLTTMPILKYFLV